MATLNETSGVITSPYYPRNYPSNQRCSWQITASKGNRVVLVIEYMNIRQCGASCTCDYLEIQNGIPSDGGSTTRRCSYYSYGHPLAYYSLHESLKVLFVSNGYSNRRGFKAIFIQVNYTALIPGKYSQTSSQRTPLGPSQLFPYGRCPPQMKGEKKKKKKKTPKDVAVMPSVHVLAMSNSCYLEVSFESYWWTVKASKLSQLGHFLLYFRLREVIFSSVDHEMGVPIMMIFDITIFPI